MHVMSLSWPATSNMRSASPPTSFHTFTHTGLLTLTQGREMDSENMEKKKKTRNAYERMKRASKVSRLVVRRYKSILYGRAERHGERAG